MNDEEIKRLLENVEVTPSAHCWEAIEGNLATAGVAGTAATATKVAGHALSTTAKIIIGAASTAAIATTAVILALTGTFSPKESDAAEKQVTKTEYICPDENVDLEEESIIPALSVQNSAEKKSLPETSPSENVTDEGAVAATTYDNPVAEQSAPQVVESKTTFAPAPSPTQGTASSSTPAKASVAPTTPKPSPKPTATAEQTQPSTLTDLSDPVLEDADVMNGIDFSQPVALVIPNIITPNGDGYNDFFVIQGIEQCDRNRLIVKNASGVIVFQTVNYKNNWGASNTADGTYFYQFVYSIHGIEETRAGTLTIMR